MKKLFISLLLILSASFMFADTLHIFIPKTAVNRNYIIYEEVIYKNIYYSEYATTKNDSFWTKQDGVLRVNYKGKLYRYNCQWYAEPDEE